MTLEEFKKSVAKTLPEDMVGGFLYHHVMGVIDLAYLMGEMKAYKEQGEFIRTQMNDINAKQIDPTERQKNRFESDTDVPPRDLTKKS